MCMPQINGHLISYSYFFFLTNAFLKVQIFLYYMCSLNYKKKQHAIITKINVAN